MKTMVGQSSMGGDNRERQVALTGPVGAGKSATAAAIFRTLQACGSEYVFDGTSHAMADQHGRLASHQKTERTKEHTLAGEAAKPETIAFLCDGGRERVSVRSRGGEALLDPHSAGVDIDAVAAEHRKYDLLVLCFNPFHHDHNLLIWAWLTVAAVVQQQAATTLGKAIEVASDALAGVTGDGLRQLGCGFERLAPELLQNGRISVFAGARFERPANEDDDPSVDELMAAFPIDGASEAHARALHRQILRAARTITSHGPAYASARRLLRDRPESIVAITHGDLAVFLRPTVSQEDLLEVGRRMFRGVRGVGMDQVVLLKNLDVVIQADSERPVWIRGPRAEAGNLIDAICRQIRATHSGGSTGEPVTPRRDPVPAVPAAKSGGRRWGGLKGAAALKAFVAVAGLVAIVAVWAGTSGAEPRSAGAAPAVLLGTGFAAAGAMGWLMFRRKAAV